MILDKLDSCLRLLGKVFVEVKDLQQRYNSANNGNSCVDTSIAVKIKTHLPLESKEAVVEFENHFCC